MAGHGKSPWLLTLILTRLIGRLERRLRNSEH